SCELFAVENTSIDLCNTRRVRSLNKMTAVIISFVLFLALLPFFRLLRTARRSSKKLPPGSLGLPFIGQSFGLLRAMRANTGERWLARRVSKYGPISKLSLFGSRAVLLTGPAANKFIFFSEALVPQQPKSITGIIGRRNILELVGDDHRRVRGALAHFLKPEVLKRYVGMIDREVRHHLETNWVGRRSVTVMPLMKTLTFDIICSLIIGLEKGSLREALEEDFTDMLPGLWAVPVNLPFTKFHRSLRASQRARKVLASVIEKKKAMLKQGRCSRDEDLISYMLSLGGEDDARELTEEEILDNLMLVMFAGYDTSAALITFMIRHLAGDPVNHAIVIHGKQQINLNDDDVFWASSITQMDEHIFEDPNKFDPTRFEKQASVPPCSFVAFGGGPRTCPGNEFARMETLVMMHYVATRFNWRLCCEENGFSRDPMPSPSQGLPVELELKSAKGTAPIKNLGTTSSCPAGIYSLAVAYSEGTEPLKPFLGILRLPYLLNFSFPYTEELTYPLEGPCRAHTTPMKVFLQRANHYVTVEVLVTDKHEDQKRPRAKSSRALLLGASRRTERLKPVIPRPPLIPLNPTRSHPPRTPQSIHEKVA
ncbi:hypothetical protein GW17_00040255, partial [Ensete ventricosum]